MLNDESQNVGAGLEHDTPCVHQPAGGLQKIPTTVITACGYRIIMHDLNRYTTIIVGVWRQGRLLQEYTSRARLPLTWQRRFNQ